MIERYVAVVFLVDPEGRILMQHRDADAKVGPNQWGLPGGKIEDGEEPEQAARREVREETGLVVDRLEHFWTGTRPSVKTTSGVVEMHVFCAPTDATQDDIVLGEGQAMVFLTPDEARERDLVVTARLMIPRFLDSEQYRRLAARDG